MDQGAPPPYYKPQAQYAPAPQQMQFYPPQGYAPAPAQMQSSSSNVVVVNQPTAPVMATRVVHPVGDHFLTLSIILTILAFFLCSHHCLLCTIPAIIFATMARDADLRGDVADARSKGRISLIFNIISIVVWVSGVIISGIVLGVTFGIAASASSYYSDTDCYNNYDSYYDSYSYYSYCYK